MTNNTIDILKIMPPEDIMEFLDQVSYLDLMMRKYVEHKINEDDCDELMASSIAYHLSRLVDEYHGQFRKLEKYRHYWREINYEAWDDYNPIPGRGKTLC